MNHYKNSDSYKVLKKVLPRDELKKMVNALSPNDTLANMLKYLDRTYSFYPHIYTLQNVKILPNNGGESKDENGKITLHSSCIWISIRDYLRLNGYPNMTALLLKQESGLDPVIHKIHPNNHLINNVFSMWDAAHKQHVDSIKIISKKYKLKIHIHHKTKNNKNIILLSNKPIIFGETETENNVHIISHGVHFDLITYYQDILNDDIYDISGGYFRGASHAASSGASHAVSRRDTELTYDNSGIIIKKTDNGHEYLHCKAITETLQAKYDKLSNELQIIYHLITIKDKECSEGQNTMDLISGDINNLIKHSMQIQGRNQDNINELLTQQSVLKNIIQKCKDELDQQIKHMNALDKTIQNLNKNIETLNLKTYEIENVIREINEHNEVLNIIIQLDDSETDKQSLLMNEQKTIRKLIKKKENIQHEINVLIE